MDIPFIAANSLGLFCIISSESVPNLSTILCAVAGPTPLIAPEDKYLSIAAALCGAFLSKLSALN